MDVSRLAMKAAVLAAATLTTGCIVYGTSGVRGSGTIATEEREISEFETLVVKGAADVDVTIGENLSLSVEADDNLLPLITTDVRGSRLLVSSRGTYRTRHGVKIVLTTPSLSGVTVSGSGTVRIDGLSEGELDLSILGSGDIVAVGGIDSLDASVSGSGDIDVSRLIARDVKAAIMGSGDIDVHATEKLEATITGSGEITYRGDPGSVDRNVLGSGSISAR